MYRNLLIKALKNPNQVLPYLNDRVQNYQEIFLENIIYYMLREGIIPTYGRNYLRLNDKIKYYEIDAPESHYIQYPDSIDSDTLEWSKNRWMNTPPKNRISSSPNGYKMYSYPPFVAEISDSTIFGPCGLVKTNDGGLLLEIKANIEFYFPRLLRKTIQDCGLIETINILYFNREYKQEINSPVASMLETRGNPENIAYGHWLLEKLPKLRGLKYYENKTNEKPKILVDSHIKDWQIETLKIMGYNNNDFVRWDCNVSHVNKFIIPRWGKEQYCLSDFQWLKNKFESGVSYQHHLDDFNDYIYLSRENQKNRHIINREDILDTLSEYGFESVAPETLSLSEQVALFKQAKIIIGPYGSSFANILFSGDAKIIQMFPPKFFKFRIYEIGRILGLDLFPLIAYSDNNKTESYRSPHTDFRVSVERINERINYLFNEFDLQRKPD